MKCDCGRNVKLTEIDEFVPCPCGLKWKSVLIGNLEGKPVHSIKYHAIPDTDGEIHEAFIAIKGDKQ